MKVISEYARAGFQDWGTGKPVRSRRATSELRLLRAGPARARAGFRQNASAHEPSGQEVQPARPAAAAHRTTATSRTVLRDGCDGIGVIRVGSARRRRCDFGCASVESCATTPPVARVEPHTDRLTTAAPGAPIESRCCSAALVFSGRSSPRGTSPAASRRGIAQKEVGAGALRTVPRSRKPASRAGANGARMLQHVSQSLVETTPRSRLAHTVQREV